MLVKAHSSKYPEDFGLRRGQEVYLYYQCVYGDDRGENKGPVSATIVPTSPVVRINAMWVEKDLKVRCHVADTETKKRQGLQGFDRLEEGEGMFFPYSPYGEQVSFHQGSVPFGLDLLFLLNDEVVSIEASTKVGSSDHWACSSCSGVIEVPAGFCVDNKVEIGDRIALFAVSRRDLKVLDKEKREFKSVEASTESYSDENYFYMPNAINLVSRLADCL